MFTIERFDNHMCHINQSLVSISIDSKSGFTAGCHSNGEEPEISGLKIEATAEHSVPAMAQPAGTE